jgi:hypothetical protein
MNINEFKKVKLTNLTQLKKSELINIIVEIRPKADCYDRICEFLGVEKDVIGTLIKRGIK